MSKVAVVYWSGTGNTEAMAKAVVEGIENGGVEAQLFSAGEFDSSMLSSYDAVAFGCPAMGAEQLEDFEFEPLYEGDKLYLQEWPQMEDGRALRLFNTFRLYSSTNLSVSTLDKRSCKRGIIDRRMRKRIKQSIS